MKYFRNLPIPFIYVFSATLIISVVAALRWYVMAIGSNKPFTEVDLTMHVASPFYNFMLWAFLSPMVYWALTKYSFHQISKVRLRFFHLMISVGFALFHEYLSTMLFNLSTLFVPAFEGLAVGYKPVSIMLGALTRFIEYWILAAAFLAIDYYKKFRENQLQLSAMQNKLVTTQLNTLRSQLHPHFLFNTLNTISALMEKNVEEGQKVIAHLGDLLRKFLDRDQQDLITLKEEMDY